MNHHPISQSFGFDLQHQKAGLDASFDPFLGHDGDHFVVGLFLKQIGKLGLQVTSAAVWTL